MDGLNDAARRLVSSRNIPSVLDTELGHLYTVVCEIDGRCMGVGALDGAEIKRVYVDPSRQGSGAGYIAAPEQCLVVGDAELRLVPMRRDLNAGGSSPSSAGRCAVVTYGLWGG
jgi:hypothetical protein